MSSSSFLERSFGFPSRFSSLLNKFIQSAATSAAAPLSLDNEAAGVNLQPLIKLLQLENAMITTQQLINSLQNPVEFATSLFPSLRLPNINIPPKIPCINNLLPVELFNNDIFNTRVVLPSRPIVSFQQNGNGGSGLSFDISSSLSSNINLFSSFLKGPSTSHFHAESRRLLTEMVQPPTQEGTPSMFFELGILSSLLGETLSMVSDTLTSSCMDEDESHAVMVLRAAALIANPVEVMQAMDISEATINDVLGHRESNTPEKELRKRKNTYT